MAVNTCMYFIYLHVLEPLSDKTNFKRYICVYGILEFEVSAQSELIYSDLKEKGLLDCIVFIKYLTTDKSLYNRS